jgi:hypothetical protein
MFTHKALLMRYLVRCEEMEESGGTSLTGRVVEV